MDNKLLVAILVALTIASLAVFLVVHIRGKRLSSNRQQSTELRVTDATTWEVRLNGITVATIAEHVVAEIERRVNREWWLGIRTAISEFRTVVDLIAVSVAAGLAIESVLIALAIEGDPRGAGHVLHAVLCASEATLQSGWSLFWLFGALCSAVYFALALMFGGRRRARDYLVDAWRTDVRCAAGVAPDGDLSLVLTREALQLWRSPRQISIYRIASH